MSTLEYLDDNGSVRSFNLVPWTVIHTWLSELNGNPHVTGLPEGINRGQVLEELEARRKGKATVAVDRVFKFAGRDRGFGKDWRAYENDQGYTHLEELLIYQPKEWRKQAREYFFRFKCDLDRKGESMERVVKKNVGGSVSSIFLLTPSLVVLYHDELNRSSRYEPLNFLLAYGVLNPLPALMKNFDEDQTQYLMKEISPLDYQLEFHAYVAAYRLDILRKMGTQAKFPRLCLIKELDYSDIIGQRLAKQWIRAAMVNHILNRTSEGIMCGNRRPLSMIFAGPSGNGKTELAHWLAKLMNKPGDDHFIKIDCGQLTDSTEMFGRAGAYQGAKEGSSLNNFVLRMASAPDALGIILLDEIEKADQSVIHGLYQVIDKAEWTDKRLNGSGSQTTVIPCHNLVFVMTTNAADDEITRYVKDHNEIYTETAEEVDNMGSDLTLQIRRRLQYTNPFTEAFVGRVDRIVPFLPMANGSDDGQHPLLGETLVVAKLLIERHQDKFVGKDSVVRVGQRVSPGTKDRMAKIIVRESIPGGGVRSIQQGVQKKMGDQMVNSLLLESGGIEQGSRIQFYAREEDRKIDFRVEETEETEHTSSDGEQEGQSDLYE